MREWGENGATMTSTLPAWIIVTQWVSRSVLFLLFVLSIWSIATMIRCSRLMRAADCSSGKFEDELKRIVTWIEKDQWEQFKEWASNGSSLYAGTARTILASSSLGTFQLERAVKSYLSLQRTRLEQGLTILATLGSNAPFVGLFGTVLGIIQAFGAMGAHQNNASEIMVGISEALVATAIGLFVAIPAVVAFNVFTRRLRILLVNAEAVRDTYLSKVVATTAAPGK